MKNFIIKFLKYIIRKDVVYKKSNMNRVWFHIKDTTKKS